MHNYVTLEIAMVLFALLCGWTIDTGIVINQEISRNGNNEVIKYIFLGLISNLCFMPDVLSKSKLKITPMKHINSRALIRIVHHHQENKRRIRGSYILMDKSLESSDSDNIAMVVQVGGFVLRREFRGLCVQRCRLLILGSSLQGYKVKASTPFITSSIFSYGD
ncbi:hypothetical protein ACH5RR_003224 [Cinchona calisaya]|uniref:Uncharacterized protein n=1 Tax=Cinchona calisaya TaxID=153742 RepID=A0ABD3AUC4_9GENT